MKFTIVVLALVALVNAVPTRRSAAIIDTDILQYALTLENLESAFYHDALSKYDEKAFAKADLPSWARGRYAQIASHEAQHVALLSGALGSSAVKPCTYQFPYRDPQSFAALSAVIEGVGVSAYLGSAAYISDKNLLTVASSILTVEARHQAWISSAINKAQPWSGPEDTLLGFNQVYSLVAPFIKSCPSSNPPLPFRAFPTLTAFPANARPGTRVTYTFNGTSNTSYYAAYYSGLTVKTVKLSNQTATIPDRMLGTYYTIITTSPETNVSDANTVAGPLVSIVDFPSSASD